MNDPSRQVILARIRNCREGASPPHSPQGRPSPLFSDSAPRTTEYRREGSLSPGEVQELFRERVSEYRAKVSVSSGSGLAAAIATALRERGVLRLLVPDGVSPEWVGAVEGGAMEILRDGDGRSALSKGQLASVHGVLTGCRLGIAETGTIVLDAGPDQGRRALSLLPDYHLCVVFGSQLVETVPEAVAILANGFDSHRRPITLISGPSATSDIELIRVEGVHGPRNLEVILVEETE